MDTNTPQQKDLLGNVAEAFGRHATRRQNTQKRYELIRQKVNEHYAKRIDGMRPDFDDVVAKVAAEVGYSERTVKDILNKR